MSIEQRLEKIFKEVFEFEADDFVATLSPEDVEKWDSLGHMNMVAAMEKEFGTGFELDEVMEMVNVGAIVEILNNKGVK